MHLIDRFTRDETSAKVWWPLALLLVVSFVLAFPMENRALAGERDRAARFATSVVDEILAPATRGVDLTTPLAAEPSAALRASIDGSVRGPTPVITDVRLWTADGRLLFSTVKSETLGSREAFNDPSLSASVATPGIPVSVTTSVSSTGDPMAPRDQVYVTVPGSATTIAEVDVDDDLLLAGLHRQWFGIKVALGLAALIVLGFAGLSIREPRARIGAGVAFYPTSVPAGLAIVSQDEAIRMRQASRHATDRVDAMHERIAELETNKRHLEGELQRALSALSAASGGRASAFLSKSAASEAAPAPMPAPAAPERVVVLPASELVADDLPLTADVPETPAAQAVIRVPDLDAQDGSDAEALEVLERLVTPVGEGAVPGLQDPGEIRARLARTAARKKPGYSERDRDAD